MGAKLANVGTMHKAWYSLCTILNDILESLMENNVEGKRSKCTSRSRGRDVLRKKRVAIGSLKVKYF